VKDYSDMRVEIPKNTFIAKIGNGKYVYLQGKCQRVEGKKWPTAPKTAIGKLDETTGQLIPNGNYFKIYPEELPDKYPNHVESIGQFIMFDKIITDLALKGIIKKVFSENTDEILSYVLYMLTSGNIMSYLPYYQDSHRLYTKKVLDSSTASRFFEGEITEERHEKFLDEWIKKHIDTKYLAYDVTSISSYATSMEGLEYGYNRDREKLRQLNLGILYSQNGMLPLTYRIYSGSIPDKTHYISILNYSRELGFKDVTFIPDQGFNIEENKDFIMSEGMSYIMSISLDRKPLSSLSFEEIKNLKSIRNYIPQYDVHGMQLEYDDTECGYFLFFNPAKQELDRRCFMSKITRMEAEMEELSSKTTLTKRYEKYFVLSGDFPKPGKFEFTEDIEAIDSALERLGVFALETNINDISPAILLRLYKTRNIVESCFDNLKNDMDFSRFHTHERKTTDGKVFCGFIALIINQTLHNLRLQNEELSKFTLKSIFLELERVKVFCYKSGEKYLNPLTKKQKTILKALGINKSDLEKYIF